MDVDQNISDSSKHFGFITKPNGNDFKTTENDYTVSEEFNEYEDWNKYDLKLWEKKVNEARPKGSQELKATYRELLKVYPSYGLYWRQYAELELAEENYQNLEEIFKQALGRCYNVDLFMIYINYMRDYKIGKSDLPTTTKNEKLHHVFEYAVGQVGLDIGAAPIWQAYIQYQTTSKSLVSEQLRETYRRALSIPMQNSEQFWTKFQEFERLTGSEKILEIDQKEFDEARKIYRLRKTFTEAVERNTLEPPRGTQRQLRQVKAWKNLIEFEKSNPQNLKNEVLKRRVNFTFNQALTVLWYYPEIWHLCALYQIETDNFEMSQKVYQRAMKALPRNLLIRFIYCDLLELKDLASEAETLYKAMSVDFEKNQLFWIQYMNFCRRIQGIQEARKIFFKARKLPCCNYHLYIAAVEIEYYMNKDEVVAKHILQLGEKFFKHNPRFMEYYADFLSHRNNKEETDQLYKRILENLDPSKRYPFLESYYKFALLHRDTETIEYIKEAKKLYGHDPRSIWDVIEQTNFMDLCVSTSDELSSYSQRFALNRKSKKSDTKKVVLPDLNQLDVYIPEARKRTALESFIALVPPPREWVGVRIMSELLIERLLRLRVEGDPPRLYHRKR